jgi:RsiW-degrading membrane proteinase PrsW (M82 family)
MCAIGQQDRELCRLDDNITGNHDYVTFEPFQEYDVKLQQLRTDRVTSFWKHMCSMSKLSYKLLQLLAWSLLVLALVAVLRVERNFTLVNLLVVLATFFQAFLVLYFVHWKWYRFDLSLDAVVKYFSSGFILATGMAVVLEMLVSAILGLISNVIILIVAITQEYAKGTSLPTTSQEAQGYAREFQREHLPLFCFFTFLNAFVVAAFVEETCKYFGFWMVETPDLNDSSLFGRVSKESKGVGITIAMVATALGFACCENLLYVFVYSPPSLVNEVTTLLARSIFPIHPLAAALQSIGVCRRDLEGDCKVGLGRILFPAIMLHGSFDFLLMVMALIQSVEDEGGGGNVSSDDDNSIDDDLAKQESSHAGVQDEMPLLMASVVIVIIGLIYYVWQADAQRIRLHELDQGGRPTGETTPLLV